MQAFTRITGVAGMHVSPSLLFPHTYILRDECLPTHISLMHYVLQVIVIYASLGILFPPFCCADLATAALMATY